MFESNRISTFLAHLFITITIQADLKDSVKYNSKEEINMTQSRIVAITGATVLSIGLAGCFGGSGGSGGSAGNTGSVGSTAAAATTAKVESVEVNETTAKTALAMLGIKNGGILPSATLAASSDKKMKLPDNLATRMAAKMKKLKISDALLSKVKEEKIGAGADSGAISQTYDCAVSGTMTLESSWERNEAPEGYDNTETNKITFNDCVDTEENLIGTIEEHGEAMNTSSLYHYSGAIGFTEHRQYSSIGHERSEQINAEHLSEERTTLAGAAVWSGAMDGTWKMKNYETDSSSNRGFEISTNMTAEYKLYDANGTVAHDEKWKADSFIFHRRESEVQHIETMSGYLSYTPDIDTQMAYIYGEGFSLTFEAEGGVAQTDASAIVPDYSVDIEGVLGADCLGGSITFSTPSVWLFDNEMPDLNVENDENGTTPYSGTTVISGAGSSAATVEFMHNEVPEAYGTITVNGNTSDPMTFPQMTEGIDCDEDLGWRF